MSTQSVQAVDRGQQYCQWFGGRCIANAIARTYSDPKSRVTRSEMQRTQLQEDGGIKLAGSVRWHHQWHTDERTQQKNHKIRALQASKQAPINANTRECHKGGVVRVDRIRCRSYYMLRRMVEVACTPYCKYKKPSRPQRASTSSPLMANVRQIQPNAEGCSNSRLCVL
jgi:hypothetical protein